MQRDEKEIQNKEKKKKKKSLKEDELELIPNEFTIIDDLAFRSDTRDPKGPNGTFAMGFQRRAATWKSYKQGYSLVLLKPTRLKNGTLIANIPSDEMIKANKLYVYLTNDGMMTAAKNKNGAIIRKAINRHTLDFIKPNTANYLLQVLKDTENTLSLSLDQEKAIFKATAYKRHSIEPSYRKRTETLISLNDIDPPTAVSVTKVFDCAPIFPVGKKYEDETVVWINIVKVHSAFLTYQEQLKHHSDLVFCMEMAMRDIPSGDVICAIKCKRYWNPNVLVSPVQFNYKDGMYYQLIGEIEWNPKLKNMENHPSMKKYKEYITKLIDERKNKIIVCPIDLNLTYSAKLKILDDTYPASLPLDVISDQEHLISELFRSIYVGDKKTIENLLNSKIDFDLINKQDSRSKLYPLHLVVLQNDIEMVKLLIKYGANINQGEGQGDLTALDLAITNKHIDIAKYLLNQKNIDLNKLDKQGLSALYRAVYIKSPELVNALLKAGAEITEDVLKIAKKKKNKEIIQLLNAVIRMPLQDDLLKAVNANDIRMIKDTVQQGANINQPYLYREKQISLLDIALHNNQFNVALTLLDLGITSFSYPVSKSVILLHHFLKDKKSLSIIQSNDFEKINSSLALNDLILSPDQQTLIMDLLNFSLRPTLDLVKFTITKKLLIGFLTQTNFTDIEFTKTELISIEQNNRDKSYLSKLINRYQQESYTASPSLEVDVEKKNII